MSLLKVKTTSLEKFLAQKNDSVAMPRHQFRPLILLVRTLSSIYLKVHHFSYDKKKINYKFLHEPCLIMMNHVYETDFKIAFKILGKKAFNIAAARDAFLGRKERLRRLGGTSVVRFSYDPAFVKNAHTCIHKLRHPLLIYPEAEYSADGLSMGIAPQFGKMIKFLGVPVMFFRTYGTYAMQPMFNEVKNKNKISVTLDEVLTIDDVKSLSTEEIQERVSNLFKNINYYEENKKLGIRLTNKNRCKLLERILYKCPHCGKEFTLSGKGTHLICANCNEVYTLNEDGSLADKNNKIVFNSIPDWTNYQREEVKKELLKNTYKLKFNARLLAFKNFDALYDIKEESEVEVDKDGIHLKYSNKDLYYPTKDCYAICAKPNFLFLGPALVIAIDDINYLVCPKEDDGKTFKIRIAVPIAYQLNKKEL